MRDNHEGLPEIIKAYERDGYYFGEVSLTIAGSTKNFEFGLDLESYKAIIRILSLRPFDQMPSVEYKYFFSPTGRWSKDRKKTYCYIRIEQERQGKGFEVEVPKSLFANLKWFFQVKDFKELAYLREIK